MIHHLANETNAIICLLLNVDGKYGMLRRKYGHICGIGDGVLLCFFSQLCQLPHFKNKLAKLSSPFRIFFITYHSKIAELAQVQYF